jgi:hypothetical protein
LIADGASHKEDPERLRSLAKELQSYPDAAFNDRLLYLEILRQLHDASYADYLAEVEKAAAADAQTAASLLSWLSGNGNGAEAVRFVQNLPAKLAGEWPVPLATAEAYTAANDWAGLQRAIGQSDWGRFNFLREAYLARLARAQNSELEADQHWAIAQKAAGSQQALQILARTVSTWGWEKETDELLWTLSKTPATQKEALQLLYQSYAKRRDTAGVYRVLAHTAELAPDDLLIRNNLAQVSLLLGVETERARKTAAELVQKEPTNAACVSTYAFSLFSDGDVHGARAAMERLSSDQLQTPPIAVYYGIILAAAGEKDKAQEFLTLGAHAFLLPEEKALVEKAESSLR